MNRTARIQALYPNEREVYQVAEPTDVGMYQDRDCRRCGGRGFTVRGARKLLVVATRVRGSRCREVARDVLHGGCVPTHHTPPRIPARSLRASQVRA